jgi:hypothetical protein
LAQVSRLTRAKRRGPNASYGRWQSAAMVTRCCSLGSFCETKARSRRLGHSCPLARQYRRRRLGHVTSPSPRRCASQWACQARSAS